MYRQSSHARLKDTALADIEQRLRALERRLDRASNTSGRAASSIWSGVSQAGGRIGDVVSPPLVELADRVVEVADRFRESARSVGGGASRLGKDATRIGSDALQRILDEIERRPFAALAIAAGIGLLIGLGGRRR